MLENSLDQSIRVHSLGTLLVENGYMALGRHCAHS